MRGFARRLRMAAACIMLFSLLAFPAWAAPVEACPGGCTHQAAIGTTHYDTLAEAVAAAGSGSTVTLLADVTADITADKSLALDLGGKTLTGTLVFTKGGTVRNGTVSALAVRDCIVALEKDAAVRGSVQLSAADGCKTRLNISGQVTGKGPLITSAPSATGLCELYILKNAKLTATDGPAVKLECAGKLEISGGVLEAKTDCVQVRIQDKQAMELAITGGKLLSREGEAITVKAEGSALIPKDFVTGGTFTKVPTAFVPAYAVIRDNADGTYTVISQYTLSFQSGDGSGTMEPVKVNCGSSLKLPECSFTAPAGMDFRCWSIDGVEYMPGARYTPNGDVTVTALWREHVHSGGKATCQKRAVCQVCGESYGSKGSHSLKSVGGYAPTCTESGLYAHKKCAVCGKRFVNGVEIALSSLSTPALGHSWVEADGIPATCTEPGRKAHCECGSCGALELDGKSVTAAELEIPPLGHSIQPVAATGATCTQPGELAHEECPLCGQQFLNGESVDAAALSTATVSHVLSDWICDDAGHRKACVDCGAEFRRSAHTDTDGDQLCDDCGYAVEASQEEGTQVTKAPFPWFCLIPLIAAVVIALLLILKKRK